MGKLYDGITPELATWIGEQKVFFVATAPLSASGRVNCSPKGGDCLRILGERRVAYRDLTGSGIETIAHVKENQRIVLMFCAFDGNPTIVRLHGRGRIVESDAESFAALAAHFPPHPGTRAIIEVEVERIADSCGWGVPLMDFKAHRTVLDDKCAEIGAEGLAEYRNKRNRTSIDGLPGLRPSAHAAADVHTS